MQIGWIDFSKNERNKVLNVMHLLDEPEAVDELGIGTIRDAFADYLQFRKAFASFSQAPGRKYEVCGR